MDTVFPFVHGMSPPMRNITALVLSLIGCLAEMKIFELLVAKRVVSRDTCRKLVRHHHAIHYCYYFNEILFTKTLKF
jgi:hypothetical protein